MFSASIEKYRRNGGSGNSNKIQLDGGSHTNSFARSRNYNYTRDAVLRIYLQVFARNENANPLISPTYARTNKSH